MITTENIYYPVKLFRKIIEANETRWLWFGGVLIGSFIPLILRLIVSLDIQEIASFDIKDCLFAGLAINLSNFNLLESSKYQFKLALGFLSTICILIIAVAIGVFLISETITQKNFLWLKLISVIVVTFSIRISYGLNFSKT